MFAGKSIVEIREIQKVVSKEGKTAQRLQENGRYSIIKYKKVKSKNYKNKKNWIKRKS